MTERTAASILERRGRCEKKYVRRSSARAVSNERCGIETLGLLTGLSETLARGRDESMCSRSGRNTLRHQHHERNRSETCTRLTDSLVSLGHSSLLENGTNIMHLEGAELWIQTTSLATRARQNQLQSLDEQAQLTFSRNISRGMNQRDVCLPLDSDSPMTMD